MSDETKDNDVDSVLEEDEELSAQAGGEVDEPEEEDRILPLERITIDKVWSEKGGEGRGAEILGCFFAPAGPAGEFMLFHSSGKRIQTNRGVRSGGRFSFDLDTGKWDMTVDFSRLDRHALGTWNFVDPENEPDSGGFSAQAGGGADTDAASSAYA